MKKFLALFSSLFFLISCTATPETIFSSRLVEGEKLIIERPAPLRMNKIDPVIVTGETMIQILKDNNIINEIDANKMKEKNQNLEKIPIIIGFSAEDFIKLMNNLFDIERYILQQNETIVFYERVAKRE